MQWSRANWVFGYFSFLTLELIAVDNINLAIRNCDSNMTIAALMKPEAQLPEVYPSAASVYQTELFNLQQQNAMVRWKLFECVPKAN